ncbi:PP2C family protein-serine/threonine phosphatase [Mycoplasmopsis iners]|uniref:PP2C family protein-serine/threonine phosphatase n=1 Tax=Mycoplasmopsis iners TaxID=76630 RepID=UPI000497F252|nr:protein phosphatase 2C domain-containing protein [Mycoplasmopsis iners]
MKTSKISEIGNKRLENQDCVDIIQKDNFTLLLLCDGMGGHFGGSLASVITVNVFKSAFFSKLKEGSSDYYIQWFRNVISDAKNEMRKIANGDEAKLDMGTTLVAALINEKTKTILVFNIGDSRIYIVKNNGYLKQVTIDQNVYNRLVLEEKWDKFEAMRYRKAHALTSALGPNKKTKIEVFDIGHIYDSIQAIIASSDGMHGFVSSATIENIMATKQSVEDKCKALVEQALLNQSTDNISVGIVEMENNESNNS